MAVTQNTYTGNGSTTNYSFTFPYLETTDIKVSVNGTNTTAYTLANATTIQFNTAPANGAAIRIYRETDDAALAATFYPGSAIRSSDLNDNFTQNLYVTQEANNVSAAATTTANTALTNANTAISTANSAVSTANAATATANTASSNAAAAVSTANTASTNASAAVSTANTASSNASAAVATANSAAAAASTAISTANSAVATANAATTTAGNAVTTANNAVSTANSAVTTANTANTNATNAVTTANSAVTTAGNAVTTANSAVSTANSATSTANTALTTANSAAAAVANAILYDVVANVAAIPGSPANNDAVEVVDSTGIESFTPISGVPAGYVGDSGLSVRIVYNSAGSTWTWIQYFPNDPENRYGDSITTLQGDVTTLQTDLGTAQSDIGTLQTDLTTAESNITTLQSDVLGLDNDKVNKAGDTMTGNLTAVALIPSGSTVPTNGVYLPAANTVGLSANGAGRLFVNSDGSITSGGTAGSPAISFGGSAPSGSLAVANSGNITSSGFITAAGFIPTNSGAPTNGVYLPAANSVAISTGGSARLFVDANGNLALGANATTEGGSLVVTRAAGFAQSRFRRSEGTADSPTAITTSSEIARFAFAGYDGSAYRNVGVIAAFSDGAVSSTSSPGYLEFYTTPSGTTSGTPRLRITSAGLVGIGTSTPAETLDVNGKAIIRGALGAGGTNYGTTGQALVSTGSSSAPTWQSVLSDYTVTTTAVNKTLANRERCTVTTGGLTITLPASPSAGHEVTVTIGSTFTNTVIARNGSNIMSLAEDMTIDKAHVSVTLYYVDATRGWRVI